MINVIVFGTGKLSETVIGFLNYKNVYIKCYCDNDGDKWGGYYKHKIVIKPQDIKNVKYDYIVIASQYSEEIYSQLISLGVKDEVIFEFNLFFNNLYELYPRERIERFIKCNDIKTIITGISYSFVGIKPDLLKHKGYSFANGSQDIYYDSKIVKYIAKNGYGTSVKYCIIGLSYYSFQYDLSLSKMNHKLYGYYEFFKDLHNAKKNNVVRISINRYIANKILNLNIFSEEYTSFGDSVNKEEVGKKIANIDCNKDYPNTVSENQAIFREYITFLKNHNIKPIVVVFPASKYYTKYFSDRIENEFHTIINKFKAEFKFQYIDYFRSNLFNDDDFEDVSHLNSKGAEKFTKILNEVIEW